MKSLRLLLSGFFLFSITTLCADEVPAAASPRSNSFWQTVIMIGIAIVFFYFILWRPEQRRRKKAEEQRSSLKKGDTVTAMGIVGTISMIKESTVILKMYDGTKIEMVKGAISDVKPGTEVITPDDSDRDIK